MKHSIITCTIILTCFLLTAGHRATAQQEVAWVENVKLVEEERFEISPASAQPPANEQVIQTLSEWAVLETPAVATCKRTIQFVVAQSGELAYEYGDYALGVVATDPSQQSFDGSYLRVWRKQNGQWLVDEAFARP